MTDRKSRSFIETTHPDYDANVLNWQRWGAAYRGGYDYAKSCLTQHPYELESKWKGRQDRAVDLNYLQSLTRTWAAFFARNPPDVNPPFGDDDILRDFDRHGHPFETYLSRIAALSHVRGHCYAVVDMPRSQGNGPVTVAQQREMKMRPYLTLLPPEAVTNWGTDDTGRLSWCLIRQPVESRNVAWNPESSAAPSLEPENRQEWMFWTPTHWARLDEKGSVIDMQAHPLGEVPVIPIRYQEDLDGGWIGISAYASTETVNREIIRLWSILDELLHAQFGQWVLEGDMKPQGDLTRDGGGRITGSHVKMGTDILLEVEAGAKLYTVGPDAAYSGQLLTAIGALITEIHRLLQLKKGQAVDGSQGDAAVSGRAKAFDFLDTNEALAAHGRQIAAALAEIFRLMDLWQGKRTTYDVSFPRDFGVDDPNEVLEGMRLVGTSGLARPPLFDAHLLIRAARQLFPNMPDADMKELVSGIMGFYPKFEAQQAQERETAKADLQARIEAMRAQRGAQEAETPIDEAAV